MVILRRTTDQVCNINECLGATPLIHVENWLTMFAVVRETASIIFTNFVCTFGSMVNSNVDLYC